MNKFIPLVGLILITNLAAISQGFVSEDNQWNVLIYDYYYGANTEVFKIEEDSLLNTITYKKVWWSHDTAMAIWTFQGLLREDSNIVYYVPPGGTEGILYNFNLGISDTCWIKNMWCGDTEVQVIIIDIDTVEYFGIERIRWSIENNSNGLIEYWIDGIGSTFGPLYSKYYECVVCPTWDLLCYHEYNTVLYMMPGMDTCYIYSVGIDEIFMADQIRIFPNPVRDKFEVWSLELEVKGVELYDLSGRKLVEKNFPAGDRNVVVDVSSLQSGVYICKILMDEQSITKKLILQ